MGRVVVETGYPLFQLYGLSGGGYARFLEDYSPMVTRVLESFGRGGGLTDLGISLRGELREVVAVI